MGSKTPTVVMVEADMIAVCVKLSVRKRVLAVQMQMVDDKDAVRE